MLMKTSRPPAVPPRLGSSLSGSSSIETTIWPPLFAAGVAEPPALAAGTAVPPVHADRTTVEIRSAATVGRRSRLAIVPLPLIAVPRLRKRSQRFIQVCVCQRFGFPCARCQRHGGFRPEFASDRRADYGPCKRLRRRKQRCKSR